MAKLFKRIRAVLLVVTLGSVFQTAEPLFASMRSARDCSTTPGVGRNCIVVREAGRRAYRVKVTWKYAQERNVGFPAPVKRSVWEANVLCKLRHARIDVLRFYDVTGTEIPLTAEMQAEVVAGLEAGALPRLVKSACRS